MRPGLEAFSERRLMPGGEVQAAAMQDALRRLEADGEVIRLRITDAHEPIEVPTLGGRPRRIPTTGLRHDRAATAPTGPSAAVLWLQRKIGTAHLDAPDTHDPTVALYAAGIGNVASLAAVFLRNAHRAYVGARAQGLPDGHFFPLHHSATVCGLYRQILARLVSSAALRADVRAALDRVGRLVEGKLVVPEEIVHVSEWLHVMRHRIRNMQVHDASALRVAVHSTCHLHRAAPGEATAEAAVLGGARTSSPTGIVESLGARIIGARTWHDCCGGGLGVASPDVIRAQALDTVRVAAREARADTMVGNDAACVATLADCQTGAGASLPVITDAQLAALLCGAPPEEVVPAHTLDAVGAPLLRKLGLGRAAASIGSGQTGMRASSGKDAR